MRSPFSAALAIGTGLIVLSGYFIDKGPMIALRVVLVEWALILAAIALLVGIGNLYYVHWKKVTGSQPNSSYSLLLIVSLTLTLAIGGWYGPAHTISMWIFNYIQVPIESSLMAILAVVLLFAGARLLSRRINLMAIVFLGTAVLVLLAMGPLFGFDVPGLVELSAWISQVPAVAGARGMIIGIGLGIVATGVRILMGADRPYGG